MKSRLLNCFAVVTLSIGLVAPVQLAAQDAGAGKQEHHHYKLVDIGTFGGPSSYTNTLSLSDRFGFTAPDGFAQVLNQRGTLVGWAETPTPNDQAYCWFFPFECYVSYAFQWHDGVKTDLGALAGEFNSSAALWINSNGLIAGYSQNGEIDPVSGLAELRAVVWDNGQITNLGTLGGNESFAAAVNDRGQVVGVATNEIPDPFSFLYVFTPTPLPNGTQTRAVLWDGDVPHDLGTLGGPDAGPALVNQRGQVAGYSYTNSIPNADDGIPTLDPFLWDPKTGMQDLGNFGDQAASINGLNNRGEVVGGLWLPGNQQIHPFLWDGKKLIDLVAPPFGGGANGEASWVNDAGEVVGLAGIPAPCPPGSLISQMQHAFWWRNGVMTDLGAPAQAPSSEADFINSKSQIVGISWPCDFSFFSAILWENGSMFDLNSLIPHGSPFFLYSASFIDDQGNIVALGVLPDGAAHAMLLVPCQPSAAECSDPEAKTAAPGSVLTEPQRLTMKRMIAAHHGRLERSRTFSIEDREADSLRMGFRESTAGRCSLAGQQCPPQQPCCPGLRCVPASVRAYCE